ncbi:unnamed protein product [Sphagnum balticum]
MIMFLLVYEILSSICRLTKSDFQEPLNIGSDEMVSMNEMAENTFLVRKDGLRITYMWIKEQIEKEKTQGVDLAGKYASSKVVGTQAPIQLGSFRAANGKE